MVAALMSFVGCLAIWGTSPAGPATLPGGLVAEWMFDEGQGSVARDSGGAGRDAKLHGAAWERQADGFALSLDGVDDYVDCGEGKDWGITGPVSVEGWIKPTRKAQGEALIMGVGMSQYLLTYYNTELCFWYVGGSGNNLSGQLALDQWNHVAGTFDGAKMALWVNGRQVAGRKYEGHGYTPGGRFMIATQGRPDVPHFKGLADNVRVYNRALSGNEIEARVIAEGPQFGMKTQAARGAARDDATQFFKTHPNEIDAEERGDSILFANRQMGLEFLRSAGGFQINRLYGIADDQDFLTRDVVVGSRDLYEIMMVKDIRGSGRDERGKTKWGLLGIVDDMAAGSFPVGSHAAKSVSWRQERGEKESKLHLEWHKVDVREDQGVLGIRVTVTLRDGDPLSYWRIEIRNPGTKYGIERVRFPILTLSPIDGAKDNVFIYPREHGGLVEDPFSAPTGFGASFHTAGAYYPHSFNMQFQALYDGKSGKGVFLGTQDSTVNWMNIQIVNTPAGITWRPGHFPPNITFAEEDYSLPYDCVAGPFHGDWFDAAQMYRRWALKQPWCRKGPLLARADVPKWYKEAPLIFYTVSADSAEGTFSVDENQRIAADHMREFLKWAGMPLPVNWYTWKEKRKGLTSYDVPFGSHRTYNQGRWKNMPVVNVHDGNYPRIGAMPSFRAEAKRLRSEGGMVCPYVALEIFDQGPAENSPYAAEAKPHMVRDLYGAMYTWSNETAWQACVATPWWQDRLTETCSVMLKQEGVGGFYLDVMQGSGLPCYWTPHGHSAGGGDAITTGMHQLVEGIHKAIKAQDSEVIATGENATEHMIDVTDGTLAVTLWPENKAPIFAAVYNDYWKRYGTELSTAIDGRSSPRDRDAFFIESASLFVQGCQVGRIRLRPRNASLSLQKPEHKEMIDFLDRLIGYYKHDAMKQYLAYGQVMRPLSFRKPSPMPMMGYTGGGDWPALWSGVFRAVDESLGIVVVNAGAKETGFEAELDVSRYGLPAAAAVNVDVFAPDGAARNVAGNAVGKVVLSDSLAGRGVTMFRVKPVGR